MVINYNDDIFVYFHMKNHYKKLQNVKSTLTSSLGIPKAGPGQSQLGKNWKHLHNNEEDRTTNRRPSTLQQVMNSRQQTFRYVGTRSDTNVRPHAFPPRPMTRRNPYESPDPPQKTRSQSAGPFIRNSVHVKGTVKRRKKIKNITKNKAPIDKSSQATTKSSMQTSNESSQHNSPRNVTKPKSTRLKAKEHEYLQFALSITEEIIRNNLVENEDILNLFEKHFEANRGVLDEDKMDHHIKLLARELCVPYKGSLNIQLSERIVSPIPVQVIGDCECVTHRNIELKNLEQCLTGSEDLKDIVVIKHSLSRVTECTEPSNSVDTIFNASTKFPSGTTVSSFGNVDILPCFENVDIDKKYSEFDIHKLKEVNLRILTTLNGSNKNNSMLEQKVQDHENNNFNTGISDSIVAQRSDILSSNPTSELSITTANGTDGFNRTDHSGKTVIQNDSIPFMDSLEQDKTLESKSESENSVLYNSFCDLMVKDSLNYFETNKPTEKKIIVNKSTQISRDLVDKECNTSGLFKFCKDTPDDDYVLINNPIYVLRSILESDERYILLKESLSRIEPGDNKSLYKSELDNNIDTEETIFPQGKVHEETVKVLSDNSGEKSHESNILEYIKCHHTGATVIDSSLHLNENDISDNTFNLSDYSMKSLSEQDMYYMAKMNYSKLLTTDYDLTPQRDDPNTTDKYHHLLVDAVTSISNINLVDNNLLLNEDYALPNLGTLPSLSEELERKSTDMLEIPTSSTQEIDNYILIPNDTGNSAESNAVANSVSRKTDNKTKTAYQLLPLISRSATFFVDNKNEWRNSENVDDKNEWRYNKNVSFNVDIPSSGELSSVGKCDGISEQCQTDQTQIDVSTSISGLS